MISQFRGVLHKLRIAIMSDPFPPGESGLAARDYQPPFCIAPTLNVRVLAMQDDDFIVATPCNALSLFFDTVFQFIACDVVYVPEEFVCHVLASLPALMGEIATRLS